MKVRVQDHAARLAEIHQLSISTRSMRRSFAWCAVAALAFGGPSAHAAGAPAGAPVSAPRARGERTRGRVGERADPMHPRRELPSPLRR